MAPIPLLPTLSTAGLGLGATSSDYTANNEDPVKNIDIFNFDNKIDFFRFMGLELKKVIPVKADKNRNNNKHRSETTHRDTLLDSAKVRSTTNRRIDKQTNQFDKMIDLHKSIRSIKECSVVIIGEKCRICGRDFKCIKDLDLHTKRRHTSEKPRRKHVVLKIGDEVMARLSIRRKHLKRAHREIDNGEHHDDVSAQTLCANEINRNDQTNRERLPTPLINFDDICDITDAASRRSKFDDRQVLLSSLRDRGTRPSNGYGNNDDDEIQEVLRIKRSPKRGPSINHETPNRTERELLLSEAIREFDKIYTDPMDLFELGESRPHSRDLKYNFIEDYSWFADRSLRNDPLDLIERNCSYQINYDSDIDAIPGDLNSLIDDFNTKQPEDENTFAKEYRRENGDVIPDFIDYTECLNDSRFINNNNRSGSDVCSIESSFYNDAQIGEWQQLTKLSDTFNGNVPQRTKPLPILRSA